MEKVTEQNNSFYIEFKKHGGNRKQIFLKFSFIPNSVKPTENWLTLTDNELKNLDNKLVKLSLSAVWKDHSILIAQLNTLVNEGLNLAEEKN